MYYIILVLILLYSSCTTVDFNNPLDSKGSNYIGDAALKDDDLDGIPNYKDKDSKYYLSNDDSLTPIDSILKINLSSTKPSWFETLSPIEIFYNTESINDIKSIYFNFDNDTLWDDSICTNILKQGSIKHVYGISNNYNIIAKITDKKNNLNYDTINVTIFQKSSSDTIAPTITLLPPINIELSINSKWVEPGYSAKDNIDGDITNRINITVKNSQNQNVDIDEFTKTPGNYEISYTTIDLCGNNASAERSIIVTNSSSTNQPPQLILKGDSIVNINIGGTYKEPGFMAYDIEDGDITSLVTIDSSSLNTKEIGTYTITYSVKDKNNHITKIYRKINVKNIDIIPPVITLNGLTSYILSKNSDWRATEPGYTAIDNQDGDITNNVIVKVSTILQEFSIDTFTKHPGTYTISYNVKDNSGNSAKEVVRNVTIRDIIATNNAPVILLNGDSVIYTPEKFTFTDPGASAFDVEDGDISDKIEIIGNVDISTAGTYTLTYKITDNNNSSDSIFRKIIVEKDITPPVITLTNSDVNIPVGTLYTEPGFSAIDDFDGNITDSVKITAKDNQNNLIDIDSIGQHAGIFIITYSVNDKSGNNTTITRNVTVADNIELSSSDNNIEINELIDGVRNIIITGTNITQLEIYFNDIETSNIKFVIDGNKVTPSTNDHGRIYKSISQTNKLTITVSTTKPSTINKVHWW